MIEKLSQKAYNPPMLKKRVYLDYAAATPIDPIVKQAMDQVGETFANPSAQYASAREAKTFLDQARKDVAMFLGANNDELVFTSGATEANNLAILGVARAAGKGQIISIGTEHASVREPLKQLEKEGFGVIWCKVGPGGNLSKTDLEKALSKDTILVTISYANSEIGTIQPLTKISKIIREFESKNKIKILFHTDASAAAPFLNCEVSRLGVDLLTVSASKVYGPKGIGVLYVRRGTKLSPIIFGGSQEVGLRAGTESLQLIVGFAEALKIAQKNRNIDKEKLGSLMASFICDVTNDGPVYEIGPTKHHDKLPNIISLSFDGINGEDIVAYLDAAGFEIATGAACEAANTDPSPGLLALGLSKSEAQGSVRISIGRQTSQAEVVAAAKALINTLDTLGYTWDNEGK